TKSPFPGRGRLRAARGRRRPGKTRFADNPTSRRASTLPASGKPRFRGREVVIPSAGTRLRRRKTPAATGTEVEGIGWRPGPRPGRCICCPPVSLIRRRAMKRKDHTVSTLNALLRGELAAAETYQQALARVGAGAGSAQLRQLHDEHVRAANT